MKRLCAAMVLLATVGVVGCQSSEPLEQVPPPDQVEHEPVVFEPVPFEPAVVEPVPVKTWSDLAAPSSGGGSATYTVRRGDTLWSIARRHYGSGQRWQDIVTANPGLVPEKMRIGQQITLP